MNLLSDMAVKQVSGGEFSKAEYDSAVSLWGAVGFFTTAASMQLFPTKYTEWFAVRLALIGAGSLVGYAFGAAQFKVKNTFKSSVDYYLAPEA